MKVTKIEAGIYRVEYKGLTVIVRGGKNYNPDSKFFRNGGFEVWTANNPEECSCMNAWAIGAKSKKEALNHIKYVMDNTTIR